VTDGLTFSSTCNPSRRERPGSSCIYQHTSMPVSIHNSPWVDVMAVFAESSMPLNEETSLSRLSTGGARKTVATKNTLASYYLRLRISLLLTKLLFLIFMFAPCINSIKNTFYCSN
jgi:hypothetical protein